MPSTASASTSARRKWSAWSVNSGCGKTTAARALTGVLAGNARISGGAINFTGRDILSLERQELRALRWREIAFVPQSAMNSLDPVYRVEQQLREVLGRGGVRGRPAPPAVAVELLDMVGLPQSVLALFPHQLSGGMRQRVAIAMALALDPLLVIADEPVTALDVIVQREVLDTLRDLQRRLRLSVIMITHDISVVAYCCDSIVVMYAGQVVESGPSATVLGQAAHPYTMGLCNAFPDLERAADLLVPIEGSPPDLHDTPAGCRFAPRCPFAVAHCMHEIAAAARNRRRPPCGLLARRRSAAALRTLPSRQRHGCDDRNRVLSMSRGSRSISRRPAPDGHARVDGLDFPICAAAKRSACLGESGSGKTTTGRLLLRLTDRPAATIRFDGADVASCPGSAQAVPQPRAVGLPESVRCAQPALHGRQSLAEPLHQRRCCQSRAGGSHGGRVATACICRTPRRYLEKYPHQMSGGQLQRVVLARALILQPQFIVADEPVSMLDVSVRAGILNVMRDVRDAMGLAAIYISHDVTLVRYVCARTLVMYRGRIVEDGPTAQVVRHPRHPYTKALIAAVPVPRVDQNRAPIPLRQASSEPMELAVGCGFRDRCPHAFGRCYAERPVLRPAAAGHLTACHLDQ